MIRSLDQRVRDVQRILDGAKSLVKRRAEIIPALVESTGLSREGVEHALLRHLETDAEIADLQRLVAMAGDAPHVHVILSANVFVAALRAIAFARAAAPLVTVRPSSRDPVFAHALIRVLSDPAIVLAPSSELPSEEDGEIHIYGRDETIAHVRAAASPRIVVRGHGAGIGVACVWDDFQVAAEGLADDVIAFDQRGCLSPRIAFVAGTLADARSFAEKVHASLAGRARGIPRGSLIDAERADARRYADTVRFAGFLYEGETHLVGAAASLVVPPSGRHLHVVPVESIDALPSALAPLEKSIVALGVSDTARRAAWPPHARISRLGAMQRPPLDGPVDLRP